MEYLPPVGWADVATKRDLDQLAVLTKRDLDHLGIEIRGEIAGLRGEMAAMEGRLYHQMSVQLRTMYLGMVATILSSIGAVAAATAIAR